MMLTAPYLISQQYGTAISKTTIQTINDRLNRTFNKLSLQPIFLLTKHLHYIKNLQVQPIIDQKIKVATTASTLDKLKNGLV